MKSPLLVHSVEIILHIAGFLPGPEDYLNLAWTCKTMYQLLVREFPSALCNCHQCRRHQSSATIEELWNILSDVGSKGFQYDRDSGEFKGGGHRVCYHCILGHETVSILAPESVCNKLELTILFRREKKNKVSKPSANTILSNGTIETIFRRGCLLKAYIRNASYEVESDQERHYEYAGKAISIRGSLIDVPLLPFPESL